MKQNKFFRKIRKGLHLLSPDRRYIVYFLLVLITSLIVLVFEAIICHGFKNTTRHMLEQHEIRVDDYRRQTDLENERIAQLAKTWETDSTQSVILDHFLRLREEKRDSYESAIHLVQESKAVLDYQLAFVKTEYEVLEIWAALLTIVFLVFSFYSFYRMDQMREEGSKIVNMIRNDREKMMDEFDSTIDEWEETKEDWEEDIANAMADLNTGYKSTVESIDRKIQTAKESIEVEQDQSKRKIEYDVEKAKEELTKKYSECTDSINKMDEKINNIRSSLNDIGIKAAAVDELKTSIKHLENDSAFDRLSKTISGLEQRIDTLEEDNKAMEFYDLYRNQQEIEGDSQD